MLVSHGIGGGPGVAAHHAEKLAPKAGFEIVRAACLHGEPSLESILRSLTNCRLHIVPLLMTHGRTMIELRDRIATHPEAILHAPIGEHPDINELILLKAGETCEDRGWAPRGATLLLVGHGSVRFAGNARAVRRHLGACEAHARFSALRYGLLGEPPCLSDVVKGLDQSPSVAVGLFMDEGPHGKDDVLAALTLAPGPIAYAGAIGTDDRLRRVIRDSLASAEAAA